MRSGVHVRRERAAGFGAVVAALQEALDDVTPDVKLVIENSAGAGQLRGGTLEEPGASARALDTPQPGGHRDRHPVVALRTILEGVAA